MHLRQKRHTISLSSQTTIKKKKKKEHLSSSSTEVTKHAKSVGVSNT